MTAQEQTIEEKLIRIVEITQEVEALNTQVEDLCDEMTSLGEHLGEWERTYVVNDFVVQVGDYRDGFKILGKVDGFFNVQQSKPQGMKGEE